VNLVSGALSDVCMVIMNDKMVGIRCGSKSKRNREENLQKRHQKLSLNENEKIWKGKLTHQPR
jgi:hypothetical protein